MSTPRRPNLYLAELAVLSVESAVQALASPVAATCTVTVDTNANMADGNIVTIDDGFRKVVYEYDKSANGVVAGRVNWAAGAGTAAQSATTLATAINANQTCLTVVDNGDGTLTLTNKFAGANGNTTNSCTAVGTLAITNFTGGSGSALAANLSATTTQKFHPLSRDFKVDAVQYLIPVTGSTADANNYWDIELKDGATSIAKWSTQTAQQGTITAGTAITLVNSATLANLSAAAGDTLSMVFTKHGSPANLPPGRMSVIGRFVS